ncbi:glycoside hydrolase family 97 protein [Cnuella takakiae]|nr:glycoside hydrolase family 97 protein [Cnuella takakiae]OLY93280.1 alpha-glucosidase [Cnuella takakiae]
MNHSLRLSFSLLLAAGICQKAAAQQHTLSLKSPDGALQVKAWVNRNGQPKYFITHNNTVVLDTSALGLVRADGDFSKGLKSTALSQLQKVADSYQLFTGKKKAVTYQANRQVLQTRNAQGQPMNLVFQVSNDGVAFRYEFPGTTTDQKTVTAEATSFHLPAGSKAWLQPMQVAKTGWERSNPAYEEHYQQGIAAGTPAPTKAGWVYPALFNTGKNWMLITEANLDTNYCATRLDSASAGGEYRVAFPDAREVMGDGALLPQGKLPFATPWRVLTVGSLATIVESTLGTDLAKPATTTKTSFIKPGKASWSWINSKDDFITYEEQKKYIDYAADMQWEYCLIDADWDRKIGYEKVAELAQYAASKNVGLLLWYNSAGDWNTVKYTPKNKLLTHESRMQEFARLKGLGIKGLKIDFFGGDGRSVIRYYHDILKDAADAGLMINFHGATLPRGWQRTYPHFVTAEAIKGFEFITFTQPDADAEPTHAAMLPFTRNAFDPMDFTPMNLNRIYTPVQRRTTSAFELALSVVFLSGVQHFAESPEGMATMPYFIKQYLRELPGSWDEVKFIDGFPGKSVVLARRNGNRWYLAGLNGTAGSMTINLPLQQFGRKMGQLITDSGDEQKLKSQNIPALPENLPVTMQPNGGFVLVLD